MKKWWIIALIWTQKTKYAAWSGSKINGRLKEWKRDTSKRKLSCQTVQLSNKTRSACDTNNTQSNLNRTLAHLQHYVICTCRLITMNQKENNRVWRIEVIWEKFNYLTLAVSGETDAHGLISTSTVDSLSLSLTLSLLTAQSVLCMCVRPPEM